MEHTTMEEPTQSRLMALPQELQDMIFDLAYPRVSDNTFYESPFEWQFSQERRRMLDPENCVIQDYPGAKVGEWLVSKRYLINAARAWVSNQTFSHTIHFSCEIGNSGRYHLGGVVCEWVTDMLLADDMEHIVGKLSNLKRLEVYFREGDFNEDMRTGKIPWVDVFDDEDFKGSRLTRSLAGVRGLSEFKAKPHPGLFEEYLTSDLKEMRWDKSWRAFEIFLREQVTRPKTTELAGSQVPEHAPLYCCSRVRFGTSKLGPELTALPSKDVPDTLDGFHKLCVTKADELMRWVRDAKQRLTKAEPMSD